MPTDKRRITTFVDDEVAEMLDRYVAATGRSMSDLVAELLTISLPGLKVMVKGVETAAKRKERAVKKMEAEWERLEKGY